MTANKSYIIARLNGMYSFKNITINEIAKMYFDYVMASSYAITFTRVSEADAKKAINNSIDLFDDTVDFSTNDNKLQDFRELKQDEAIANFRGAKIN